MWIGDHPSTHPCFIHTWVAGVCWSLFQLSERQGDTLDRWPSQVRLETN